MSSQESLPSLPPLPEAQTPDAPSEPSPGFRGRTKRRVAEVLFLTVLFLFALEATCRVEDWIQYRTSLFAPERSQMDLLVRDAEGMHGRPSSHFQKWSLNAFGMRGPEVARVKPPDVIRIVTVGASETFGLYESNGREYPRQLEDSLNARFQSQEQGSCKLRRAQVLNAAMPGMTLPTGDQDLRLRVRSLEPDVVVLYPTPGSYLEDSLPRAARPDSNVVAARHLPWYYALYPRARDRIRSQIKALLPIWVQDWLRHREINAVLRRHPPEWRFGSLPLERLKAYEMDLRHAVGTIRSIGSVPVLMTHANRFVGTTHFDVPALRAWEKFYPRSPGHLIVAFDSASRLTTEAVARDSQAVVVDVATDLAPTRGAAFNDFSHFTDLGAALIAGALTTSILATASDKLPYCLGSSTSPPIHL